MEKIVYFDSQGRLYIPEEIRRKLQFKTLVLKTAENGLFIEPIEDDPIQALGNLGRDKLKAKSIKEIRERASEDIHNNAIKKIRR